MGQTQIDCSPLCIWINERVEMDERGFEPISKVHLTIQLVPTGVLLLA